MKKFCLLLLILCCLVSMLPVSASATEAEEDDRTISNGCFSLDAARSFLGDTQYVTNAVSIVMYETQSHTLMYEYNPDIRYDPASLVKIMTGLLVVEQGSMTDAVTITSDALQGISTSAATAKLLPGEVLTVEQLMHCMLVSSANDAAAVLACYVAGSTEAFVDMMNARAAELGCTETNFANVHGLYDPDQYSSARDLAKILDAALVNEDFRRVFCTTVYTIPATNQSETRYLSTGNYLLSYDDVKVYKDDRVIGGRTGITDGGQRNLATLAQYGNMELVCILLGAESQLDEDGYSVKVFGGYEETSTLLYKGFVGLQLTMVTRDDQVLAQMDVINGECDVVLGPVNTVYAVLPKNLNLDSLRFEYSEEVILTAPIEKGDIVAFVDIWYEDICVAQTELYAMNSVDVLVQQDTEANSPEETNGKSDRKIIWTILIILGVIAILLIVLKGIGRSIQRKNRNRSRQYRRNHRRSY